MPFAGNTVVTIALTPTARSAAVDVTEESYDISSVLQGSGAALQAGDLVLVSTPATFSTNHCGVVGARVVDATHIAIQWGNFTAAANVPPSGTYRFLIQRT